MIIDRWESAQDAGGEHPADRRRFLKSLAVTFAAGVGLTQIAGLANAASPDSCAITCVQRCGDGYCPDHGLGGNHFHCSGCGTAFEGCYNRVCSGFCLATVC